MGDPFTAAHVEPGYIAPMLNPSVHAARRAALMQALGRPVLLMGNGNRAANLPMNSVPFRQDSTFLYYVGCDLPGVAALIEPAGTTLFTTPPAPDDALWHGEVHTLAQQAERYGVDEAAAIDTLEQRVAGLSPAVLAVGDEDANRRATALTGTPLRFGSKPGDSDLIDVIIAHRRRKSDDELDELRRAAAASVIAHRTVMSATHPGVHERELAALFQASLAARGCGLGYGIILSQRGEVLHNFEQRDLLESGRLLLLDGGGEVDTGYGVDITRTWPVSGVFSPRQRAAYEAVLAAQAAAIEACRPGVRYREVHLTSARVLAQFLLDERLVHGSIDAVVENGAHAAFYPHGVGHHLGLDVHDLENFGDRPSYPAGRGRDPQFGLSYLRLDLPLERGWVVTVEPGFYIIPALLEDPAFRERLGGLVDFDRALTWSGFGGIRIEDDVAITSSTPEVLTGALEKSVAAVEARVGSGQRPLERLC